MADAVDRFAAELAASDSATALLQRGCAGRTITAAVDRAASAPPPPEQRAALAVGRGETIAYRRVRLMCGPVVLSTADNWYVPERLTPAMRAALDRDIPFGAVIRPLEPVRRTQEMTRLGHDPILRVAAIVLAADTRPLAYVVETYTAAVLTAR